MNCNITIQQKVKQKLFPAWEKNIPTLGTKCSQPGNKTTLRFVVMMLLMMLLGVNASWGAFEGLYYIKSNANAAYYLCPSIGCYYGNNVDQPHLTTFKTEGDQYSIWKIVPVEGETDTYYIIHYKTGRYLKSNENITTVEKGVTKNNRKAVHLEVKPETLTDDFKFLIKNNSSPYQIYPKVYWNTDVANMSFNPTNEHQDCYAPADGAVKDGGAKGMIGLYSKGDNFSKWQISSVPSTSTPCATPIIKYDGDNINISYPYSDETEITIYYTTDGSDPSTGTSNASTNFNISASGVVKVRAIATKTGLVNSDEAVLWGSARPFLIQSKECADYYLVPAGDGTNINTSSLPGTSMQWTLQNAGASTGGVQYYYVVNSNNKKINYNSSDNTLTLNEESADANKFCVVENGYGTGYFFLIPVSQTDRVLYKNNGNVEANNCKAELNKKWDTNLDQWKVIACNETADQKNLFSTAPFSVSNDNETHYYHIASVGQEGYYIVPPAEADGYATTSNTGYNDTPWLFKVAASDNWLTYYYIINAASGKYMYFNPNNNQTADQENVISLKAISEKNAENEEKFQFIMVRSTTTGACYIVPKGYSYADVSHKNFNSNKYFGLWANESGPLKSTWSRISTENHVKWTFSEAPITNIHAPVISQDENGYISISHPTVPCDIYYTTDGSDPNVPANPETDPTEPTLKYSDSFLPSIGVETIKAVAVLKSNYGIYSSVEYPLPAYSKPSISFNNTTSTITITSSAEGATIYYTIDGSTEPTVDESVDHGTTTVTITGITDKTTVKAIAIIAGYQVSEVETVTIQKVATPTFELTTNNQVKISSTTSDATIYYTIDGSDPTTSSTEYTEPLTDNVSNVTIKAIAVKEGMITSTVGSGSVKLQCAAPVISLDDATSKVSITSATEGSTIYYTTDGTTPTASSTEYSGPFSLSSATTLKAIAINSDYEPSTVTESALSQVATPTIQNNGSNAISITTTTSDATIYYTTDGSDPTTSSTEYTDPLSDSFSGITIKAIAVKAGMITSAVGSGLVKFQCATPVITRDGMTFTLSCSKPTDAKLYYTLEGGSETLYSGPVAFTSDILPITVTALARHDNYIQSETASMLLKNGAGTPEDPYLIYGSTDFSNFITNVNNGEAAASASYKLASDVSASGSNAITTAFTGSFDGDGYTISGLGHALFNNVNGGVVKNVILDNVGISSGTNVGAICNEATGATRIYNCGVLASNSTVEKDENGYDKITSCSSSIRGSNYVGSIVGLLDGSSRVINCFSYANVNGGSEAGGIVGHNNVATTATNLQTMVMNCMFYGEVSGSSIAPIYNGEIITNVGENTGVSNYNYFRLESSYIQNTAIIKVYNCALGAETRFLQRFEFYRHLLNSHRELAAWWATGSMANKDEMMKWVLEPSQIGSSTPYPILKAPGYYPSVVNIDAENAPLVSERNKGGKLGTLSVTIESGSGAVFSAPTGASITKPSLTLNITDKDFDHFNFNYYKVQLPYYNEVGTGNYTGNRVVTGWKIVSITGGTPGTFSTNTADAPSFNFADRNCTNKDLYSESGRVFNQGAYWDVPEGVTAITIQPYWAKAAYVADAYPDVVYNTLMTTAYNVPNVGGGQKYTNNTNYDIAGEQQKVFTTVANAVTALNPDASHTVHDYAVVLVGNVHQYTTNNGTIGSKKYTVTTIDLDHDNEPDYSLMLRNDGRNKLHPAKWDFLNIVGLGMAQKSTGGTGSYNQGIFQPLYWFETTNTSLFRVTQFEYDNTNRIEAPLILQGGVMEQWVSGQNGGRSNKTTYFHVGGNVWFKEFHRGTHQDQTYDSKHPPVSVTGGDYDEFYLTGLYTANVASFADNAECYINGGRFGIVAGAAMEGIGKANGADDTGNITWQVQNADIREFYAGGINAAKPVTGNLSTTITGGKIDLFCGGPKFGDMSTGKTVTTNATDCIFGTFFGAGYGGNSYSRQAPRNHNNIINFPHNDKGSPSAGNHNSWNDWLDDYYTQSYNGTYGGVSTQFSYQFLPMSGNVDNCARIFVEYVKFSLATCRNVTSTLTGCQITGNFYGGGSLGKVDGPVTSTLTNCEVQGSVFGAGFSASMPSVEVDNIGFSTEPYYYTDLGTYRTGVKSGTVTYKWQKKDGDNWVDNTNHILYTDEDLTTLGAVTGKATLTINGTTTVAHSVYGGGEESGVGGDTEVNISGGTIGAEGLGGAEYSNVFGGGKGKAGDKVAGYVKGNTAVNISQAENQTTTIYHNIYGGGAYGSVGDFTYDATSGMPTALATANTGACTVTITGGTIGSNGKENGMVFGSSRGDVAIPEGTPAVDPNDRMAWVYSTHVTIGDVSAETSPTIKGSVYGSGENGHTFQNTIVDIVKGTIGITDPEEDGGAAYAYRGNVYGGGCGTDKYDSDGDETKDAYNPLAGIVRGTTTINITGGQIAHNVYGAGAMGSVGNASDATSGKTTINISGGRIGYDGDGNGHVFGAARGDFGISTAASGLANVRETEVNINYATTPGSDNEGKTEQLIAGSVFGGGEAGTVKGSVAVNMAGGLIMKDIYGGGALADTQTSNWDAALNNGAGGWAYGKKSSSTTTTVRLTGGTVLGEAYGGGLGETGKPAYVWGDVLVDLNGTTPIDETTHKPSTTGTVITNATGCVVGQVFGCNNINGTPKGDVMVHVYATQNAEATQIANSTEVTNAKEKSRYDVSAVYGGGNQAAYEPEGGKSTTKSTNVIIDGCGLTSIQTVYGGGNAASTPATKVTVNGTFEIEELFGGGNGKDDIVVNNETKPNPGANVGFYDYSAVESTYDTKEKRQQNDFVNNYVYGSGKASVNVYGGTIHRVFGGSNTKGNVRQTAVTLLDENSGCEFCVDEAYGGGKSAPMDAEAKLLMSCIPGLSAAYGGAEAAAIQGNVTLNITNGTFDRVFGGNNLSGTINGSITVNVEEVGCKPIMIGELYGGGNQAGYSVYGYDSDGKPVESGSTPLYNDPQVNVKSFTSIGNIFGGGYGSGATMVGNPTVNVNEVYGRYYNDDRSVVAEDAETPNHYPIPSHAKGKMGAINNVFGGGNAAKVIGNTNVNIGTLAKVSIRSFVEKTVTVGTSVEGLGLYTRSGAGTEESPYTYIAATGNAVEGTKYYEEKDVENDVIGADIRGNVYGGGNEAEVTGNTNVNIGKKE